MVVAILQVHLKNGFFAPTGVEFPLSLLASTALIAIAGAGGYSVDSMIDSRRPTQNAEEKTRELRKAA
jgi:putative oxidoreductase